MEYQVTHHVTFDLGYHAIFVEGVALALDNANTGFPPPTIDNRSVFLDDGGSLVLDGLKIGVNLRW